MYIAQLHSYLVLGTHIATIPAETWNAESSDMDHTMICRHGGLTFVRHNEMHA